MSKAKKIFKKVWISHFDHSKETDEQLEIILKDHDYIFEAMDEYAAEVSRERAEDAFKAGMVFQEFDTAKDFNEWWEWLKEQEGEKNCPHCGNNKVIVWGPDADKCKDCELTWDV